jgi:hypothetical protein
MNKYRIVLSAVLLVFILGTSASQFAQEQPNQQDRSLALGLLRTINTAEVVVFSERGSYVSWDALRDQNSKYLDEWLATYYSHDNSVHFAALPQVLPEWRVRLNVHPDGKGYDVRVQGVGKDQRYAALSDESGVIWQAESLH